MSWLIWLIGLKVVFLMCFIESFFGLYDRLGDMVLRMV